MSLRRHLTSASSAKSWISSRAQDNRPQINASLPCRSEPSWAVWLQIISKPTTVSTKSATHTSLFRWYKRELARRASDPQQVTVEQRIRSTIPQHSTSIFGHFKTRVSNGSTGSKDHAPYTCFQCRALANRSRMSVSGQATQSNRGFCDYEDLFFKTASRITQARSFSSAISTKQPQQTPSASSFPLSPAQHMSKRTNKQISYVERIRRILEQHIRASDPDALYEQFWRICQEETIDNQRQIWSRARLKQSSIYRMFNNPIKPTMTRVSQPIIKVLYSPNNDINHDMSRRSASSLDYTQSSTGSSDSYYQLQFISTSHPARLLQMHRYFEAVLGIPAGSDARLALIVAYCSLGDMFIAERLFREFSSKAGEEMYGAMIRGWISKTSNIMDTPDLVKDHWQLGRRHPSRINSAMELFYEMQQRGIVPSFETYHTLTIALATFKNDLEAAELMLQHMILRKGKPYVQVLHILLREYARRGDFQAMTRIFGLYDEYGLQLKPISGNVLLKAVFQLRDDQVEAMTIDHHHRYHWSPHPESSSDDVDASQGSDRVLQFKRKKIAEIRAAMSRRGGRNNNSNNRNSAIHSSDTSADEYTFGTLIYGYGHLHGAQQDLETVIDELKRSRVPMTTVLWTSIVMARIGQRQLDRAEAAMDEAVAWYKDRVLQCSHHGASQPRELTGSTTGDKRGWRAEANAERRAILPVPRGIFHVIMVAMVECGNVTGMERTMARMMDLYEFCAKHESTVVQLAAHEGGHYHRHHHHHPHHHHHHHRRGQGILRQQEADEYTANILLLGYLLAKDVDKAKRIARQIELHPSWETRRGHAGIEVLKQQVFQAAKNEAHMLKDSDDRRTHGTTMQKEHERGHESKHKHKQAEEELEDDIEIDVQALTHRLRSAVERERRAAVGVQSAT